MFFFTEGNKTVICIAYKRLKMWFVLRAQNAHKFVHGRGSAPDPAGELTALPRPLAKFLKKRKRVKRGAEGGAEGRV